MVKPGFIALAAAAAIASTGACSPGEISCPLRLADVSVAVRDAITGAPAAQGATGHIQSRDYTALLWPADPTDPLWLVAAPGDPGFYSVFIQKPGYSDWSRSRVWVPGGACGTQSVDVRADLQPAQ